jgi:RHS repeat-associated protein
MIPVSSVEIQTQILGAAIAIIGTNLSLHYSSDRALGRQAAYTLDIPLTGNAIPEDLKRVLLEIEFLGDTSRQFFKPEPSQRHQFTWNGCDAEGNKRTGKHPATVRTSHIFKAPKLPHVQENTTTLGVWEAKTLGLGGWTFNVHHYYDRVGKVLYLGNGERRTDVTAISSAIQYSIDPPKSPLERGTLANAPLFKGGWGDLNVPDNGFAIPSESGGLLYLFDEKGTHLQTVNTLTRQVVYRFEYTESGLLSAIANTHGKQVSIKRDEQDNPVEIISEYGDATILCVNSDGYLNAIANPAGAVSQFDYTPLGLLTQFSDPNGNLYQFEYDDLGLLRSYNEPDGSFFILERTLTDQGFKVSRITTTGRESTYLTESMISGGERQINQGCGGSGAIVAITDKEGKETITYPDGTILIEEKQPDPRFGDLAPLSKQTTFKTPSGRVATVSSSRTVELSNPDDPLSIQTLTDTVEFNGRISTTTYDAVNRKIYYKSAAGRQSVLTLDEQGRTIQSEIPGLEPVRFSYGDRGQLLSVQQADQTLLSYQYDNKGRLSSLCNAEGNTVRYVYDEAGRIVESILPSGKTNRFGYDANGNLTEIIVPSGAVHRLQYNAVNAEDGYVPPAVSIPSNLPLTRGGYTRNSPLSKGGKGGSHARNEAKNDRLDPENQGGAYANTYDSEQQLTSSRLPSDRTITSQYSDRGYLEQASYPEATIDVIYEQDSERVAKLVRRPTDSRPAQELSFSYDDGLVKEMTWRGVANGCYRYRYNEQFHLVGMQLDDQPEIVMERDADGLLMQQGRLQIHRDEATGAPTRMTDGRMAIDVDYDNLGRIVSRTHQVNGRVIYQLQLKYDVLSRIMEKQETVAGKTQTHHYTYDTDGQLIIVHRDGELVENYVYDANGNRTEWQLGTEQHTASYDAQDRLIELDGTPYKFDVDGFLIQRGNMTLDYSTTGELLEVSWPDKPAIQYAYDSMNRRVARTDEKGTEQYLYGNLDHPFQVTAVRDRSGNLSVYEYDEFGSMFAIERSGSLYYVATDQLGSPRVVAHLNGEALKILEYNSFGHQLTDSNIAFDLPINFAAGLREIDAKFVRFGFRDYETIVGKWTAKDPIGFGGGDANLYRYVNNSVVDLNDPTGQFAPAIPAWAIYAALTGLGLMSFNSINNGRNPDIFNRGIGPIGRCPRTPNNKPGGNGSGKPPNEPTPEEKAALEAALKAAADAKKKSAQHSQDIENGIRAVEKWWAEGGWRKFFR